MDTLAAEDDLQIRALVARYHDAVGLYDVPAWASTWAADATWQVLDRTWSGRDAIVEAWGQVFRGRYEGQLHLVGQGTVWRTSAGAEGRWTLLEIGRKFGEEVDHVEFVCYLDRYTKESGQWLFAERRFHWPYRNSSIPKGLFSPFPPLS